MFLYVTFLRAPPVEAQADQPLVITPQITNDLRTELCQREADVYYAWFPTDNVQVAASQALRSPGPALTKLTTWKPSTAYRDVNVFPPKGCRNGEKWRLYLCVGASAGIANVDLCQTRPPFGMRPFPVLSTPIIFTAQKSHAKEVSSSASSKQLEIERKFMFSAGQNTTLTIREHLSFDLDKKVWDSGIGLSYWLSSSFSSKNTRHAIVNWIIKSNSLRILELGAGTGLVSLILGALLSKNTDVRRPETSILATDLPSAMEVINNNIYLNVTVFDDSHRPKTAVLDWDSEDFPRDIQNGVDLVVMADVTYNTASFPSLVTTLRRVSHLKKSSTDAEKDATLPRVLLAFKERDSAERTLWPMLSEIGLTLHEIARIPGAGGAPVEIYLGEFSSEKST